MTSDVSREAPAWLKQARAQRWTPEVATAVFEVFASEGGTLRAFATRYGLPYDKVCKHRRQSEARSVPGFVELAPVRPEPARRLDGALELSVGAVRVTVREDVSQALLVRVLSALKESSTC